MVSAVLGVDLLLPRGHLDLEGSLLVGHEGRPPPSCTRPSSEFLASDDAFILDIGSRMTRP